MKTSFCQVYIIISLKFMDIHILIWCHLKFEICLTLSLREDAAQSCELLLRKLQPTTRYNQDRPHL